MKFINKSINPDINLFISIAERMLESGSRMLVDIEFKNDFKYNSGSGPSISHKLSSTTNPVDVYFYKPFYRWSKAVGYYDGKAIHINLRKYPYLSKEDIVGLLLHEWAHHCGFTHGNNYKTEDKVKYSVPYFISENISRWI